MIRLFDVYKAMQKRAEPATEIFRTAGGQDSWHLCAVNSTEAEYHADGTLAAFLPLRMRKRPHMVKKQIVMDVDARALSRSACCTLFIKATTGSAWFWKSRGGVSVDAVSVRPVWCTGRYERKRLWKL